MTHRRKTPSDSPSRSAQSSSRLSRRSLVGGAAALGAAASLPRISFAQDATPAAGTPGATPVSGGTQLVPGQIQYPSGREGVPDAYTGLPEPFVSSAGAPGKGGTVRAFTIGYQPPPIAKGDNQYWQELERRLGVTWEIDITPQPNYGEKSATYFAGGDLPDLFYLNPGQNAPQQYQAMAQGAFLDLTDYVTGDALQQFPNLAAIPQDSWNNARFQGRIIGVPATWASRNGNVPFVRADWAETVGLAGASGPDQVRQLMTAYTQGDPNGNGNPDTWGQGRFEGGWLPFDNTLASTMFRVPFDWRLNADGTMTSQMETDEYRQAIDWMRQLFADGSYHPDSPSMTFADAQSAFTSGQTGLHSEGYGSFYGAGNLSSRLQLVDPAAQLAPLFPVGLDGQPGVVRNTPGYFGYVAIPASVTDEARIMELLSILNYLVAPFGSEEYNFITFGIEGVHFDRNADGFPIVNDRGRAEKGDLVYLMPPLPVYFYPEQPELALTVMDGAIRAFDLGIDNPALTLYSPANVELGPQLAQFGADSINSLVTGRESFDRLDAIVQDWRDRGGDQIRQEFEEALQQQGG